MIGTNIIDGVGTKVAARVVSEGALLVVSSGMPPLLPQKTQPFRQYLTDDGTSTGSNDMGVDGSVINASFWVQADNDNDRYIANIAFILGYGTKGKPYLFADQAALTNGCRLFYNSIKGEIDLHDGLKTNQDMFRLQLGKLITNKWELRDVNKKDDFGYFVSFDLTMIMPPYGIKLDAGTSQRLTMTIRDDATNADSFNGICYGFDRFE